MIRTSNSFQGITWIFFVVVFSFCSSQKNESAEKPKSPRIRKKVELVSPESGQKLKRSAALDVKVLHRDSVTIDSIAVKFQSRNYSATSNEITIDDGKNSVGKHSLSVTAYFENTSETVYSTFVLVSDKEPQPLGFRIIATYPHDEDAYTQGLFFQGDTLYESTGLQVSQNPNSISSLRKYHYQDGKILLRYDLDREYFGEGATIWNDQVYQLTYTSKTAFVYNKEFELLRSHRFETETSEGWGLTTYGDTLIMSDGSENLYFLNPQDFSEYKRIQVYDHEGPVLEINELEMVNGKLYANLWTKIKTVIINPLTGEVESLIDFQGIITGNLARNTDYAMNGIAWHEDNRFFVTGKWWPELYEVVIFPKDNL